MYNRFKDLHQTVRSNKPWENKKAKVLWAWNEAKDRGVDLCDTNHKKEIKTSPNKTKPLNDPSENPTAALAKAWTGFEQGESVPSVASEL